MKRILIIGVALVSVAAGQTVGREIGREAFDAVAIRPSAADARGGGFNLSPGHLNGKNVSLQELVRFAYDLHDYQVSGDSGWMDTEHYDIVAAFPTAATSGQRAQMVQTMLAERFALTIHRDSKDVPGYALVAPKGGAKLHPPEAAEHGMMLGRSGTTGQRTLHGTSAKMVDLAAILSDLLGRPVQDATGLAGTFDFSMEWTPDPVSEGPMRKGGDKAEPSTEGQTGPSIFTALQETLGLKLETKKVPVVTVVIDHAEKPSAN